MNKLGLVAFLKQYFTPQPELYRSFRQVLNYRPKNPGLFQLAITHKSANLFGENQALNNERLEYLGDAVLNTVVADTLYHHYPSEREGFLTKMRSKIVSRETLNDVARKMGIDRILVSRLDEQQGANALGDALEALVGAIFLDAGFERAKKYICRRILYPYIDLGKFECLTFDYKSQLIEWSQKNDMEVVFEDVQHPDGNPHQPVFVSKVKLQEEILGKGEGHSKKEAQQRAAREAIDLCIEF